MSALVKLASKLPGDFEINGLDPTVDELIDDPQTLRAGFVLYDVTKIVRDADSGEEVPTIRVRRFEPLGPADDVSEAIRTAYFDAVEKRTGRKALPLDVSEIVELDDFDRDGDE